MQRRTNNPIKTPKIGRFAKAVNYFRKNCILDVLQGFEYGSEIYSVKKSFQRQILRKTP